MIFRNLLKNKYDRDSFDLARRMERFLIFQIRDDLGAYDCPPINERYVEKLTRLHINFLELAEEKHIHEAYENMKEYSKTLYFACGVFDKDDETLKKAFVEKFSLIIEAHVYDELGINDDVLYNKHGKPDNHYKEYFERAKRLEKLTILEVRDETHFETPIFCVKNKDLEKLANLHLEGKKCVKNNNLSEASEKFLTYSRILCEISNIFSKHNIDKEEKVHIIKEIASIVEKDAYSGIKSNNIEEKATLERINKDITKGKCNRTSKSCIIM